MSEHFRAFSFVDRIHSDEVGQKITGSYHIPEGIEEFPLSLVSESIGQCAAMSSMKAVDFKFRPVAGIAGAVDFSGEVKPGDTLELEANLVKADEEAVGYGGVARVNGKEVVRLHDCLGPMVPMEDFDDPDAVSARYDLLSGEGAEAGAFSGVPSFAYEAGELVAGESVTGTFQIPEGEPFFKDHFPRNPVFPGTLLMNLNLQFVQSLIDTLDGGASWKAVGMTSVKLRAFMPPGESLSLSAEVEEIEGDKATILVQSRRGKRLNSSARVLLQQT
ncbi:MAG: hypothetical protein P1U58_15085 [Verrucomicrobiales bacterium]|nr:hypothetical protein [Verrucomicrobiales bacterium]